MVVPLLIFNCIHQHLKCCFGKYTTAFVIEYQSQHQGIAPVSNRGGSNPYPFNWHCVLENKKIEMPTWRVRGAMWLYTWISSTSMCTQFYFTWFRFININVRTYLNHVHLKPHTYLFSHIHIAMSMRANVCKHVLIYLHIDSLPDNVTVLSRSVTKQTEAMFLTVNSCR